MLEGIGRLVSLFCAVAICYQVSNRQERFFDGCYCDLSFVFRGNCVWVCMEAQISDVGILILNLPQEGLLSVLFAPCRGSGDTQRNFLLNIHSCFLSQGKVLEVFLEVELLLLLHLKRVEYRKEWKTQLVSAFEPIFN